MRAPSPRLSVVVVLSLIAGLAPAFAVSPQDKGTPPEAVLLPPAAVLSKTASADSILGAMIAGVDADSSHAFLEKISGEVPAPLPYGERTILTRFSGTRGDEHATDFLEALFQAYGYETEIQYYRYINSLQAIYVGPAGQGFVAGQGAHILSGGVGGWTRTKAGIDTLAATFRDLDHAGGDRYVFVGNAGAIVTTDDGGATFSLRQSGTTERIDGVAVLPSGVGWAAGRNGTVLKTTDGGETWAAQSSGLSVFLRDVCAFDDTTAVIVGDGGTVLRTENGGTTWPVIATGVAENLNGLSFAGLSGWAVGSGGRILATSDGGVSWSVQTSGSTSALQRVSFSDDSRGWAVGSAGTILRTTDGGTTWSAQTNPWPSVGFRDVSARSADEGWVVAFGGHILHTTDGGTTWENLDDTIEAGWANVTATKTGTTSPDEEVLLVGHFDSESEISETLAPGADDNGSGIAAIVESARNMADARFRRTIRFVCVSGEESGLIGSEAYAARAAATGQNIVGAFNLDSVGWNDNYFRLFSNDDSAWLGNIAASAAATYAPGLDTYHWYCPDCTWSDHASFWSHGFDAIVGIETWDPAPPQHHTSGDTLGLMDMALVANVTKISLATIATVAGIDTSFATGVAGADTDIPERDGPALDPAEPNPFNPTTTLRFHLPSTTRVELHVFNSGGRLVRTLVDGNREAGDHAVVWTGDDDGGRDVPSGVYFYRMKADRFTETKKMVLVR
ncbi:MAG: M20/M25/M40 family metallo-hydrolase [Candidatus Eisenbacteria bacterium]